MHGIDGNAIGSEGQQLLQQRLAVSHRAGGASGEPSLLGRLHINMKQGFSGVDPEVWDFSIGGYRVLEKWFKYRRGHCLSFDEVAHVQDVVAALGETLRIMGMIDETVEEAGGWSGL